MSATLSDDWGGARNVCVYGRVGIKANGVKTEGPGVGDQWEQKGPGRLCITARGNP